MATTGLPTPLAADRSTLPLYALRKSVPQNFNHPTLSRAGTKLTPVRPARASESRLGLLRLTIFNDRPTVSRNSACETMVDAAEWKDTRSILREVENCFNGSVVGEQEERERDTVKEIVKVTAACREVVDAKRRDIRQVIRGGLEPSASFLELFGGVREVQRREVVPCDFCWRLSLSLHSLHLPRFSCRSCRYETLAHRRSLSPPSQRVTTTQT